MSHSVRLRADRQITKLTLLAASCFAPMVSSTISPTLRNMRAAFADVANVDVLVRLTLTLPALLIVVGAPVAGWVVDRYGRKTLLLVCTLLFGLAGSTGFVAPTLGALLVGRAVLGLTAAGLMTSVTTLITDYYTGSQRTRFIGIQAATMGVGGTVFLAFSGMLAEQGWRWPFLLHLAAFLVAPLVVLALFEPERAPVTAPGADNQVRVPTPDAQSTRWPIGFMIFAYGTVVLSQIVFYLIPVEFSFYLNDLVGATGQQAGLAVAIAPLTFAGGSLYFKRLRSRLASLQVLTIGFAIVGGGYVAIGTASGWALILAGLPLAGFGLGLIVPNLNVWIANAVPAAIRGRALGLFTTSIFLGQFLSPLATRPITRAGSPGLTYIIMGLLMGAATLAGLIALGRNILGDRTQETERGRNKTG